MKKYHCFRVVFFSASHFWVVLIAFVFSFAALTFFTHNIFSLHLSYQLKSNGGKEKITNGFLLLYSLLHLGNFAGWVWTAYFIDGVRQLVLSGSFSSWYWTMHKNDVPQNIVQHSALRTRK